MKNTFKKIVSILLCFMLTIPMVSLFACGSSADLKIYNCYEYIDESLVEAFEQEYDVKVEYTCFDTPEDCYNKINMGSKYDLICPSDYMIEKMAREDMLEEIILPENGAYRQNVSPYIDNVFKSISWQNNGATKSLYNYAAGYMWGTLGLVYNSNNVNESEVTSWSSLWNTNKTFSVKDSVRDTYFICLAKKYNSELISLKNQFQNSEITLETYQNNLKAKFNDTSETTVQSVETILRDLCDKALALEVDDGKDRIIRGETDIYFAWSGDAVYAISEALDQDISLKYSVPEEGSNVWFDGWCVPKGAQNKDLALKFIDFISRPENVAQNMEYIGYVSCIGGSDVFNWVVDTYSSTTGTEIDLNYFFKGASDTNDYKITVDLNSVDGIMFSAQYPAKNIIDRCVVMNYFPSEDNERIVNMWMDITSN